MKQYSYILQVAIVLILYLTPQIVLSEGGLKQKTANNKNGYIFQWDILILKLLRITGFVKHQFVKLLYQFIDRGYIPPQTIIIQSIPQQELIRHRKTQIIHADGVHCCLGLVQKGRNAQTGGLHMLQLR